MVMIRTLLLISIQNISLWIKHEEGIEKIKKKEQFIFCMAKGRKFSRDQEESFQNCFGAKRIQNSTGRMLLCHCFVLFV